MRRLILILSLALAACATTRSSGDIAIETATQGQALTGANCEVRTGAGSWNVVTPGTVNVGSAVGDLRVVCDKPGYRTSEMIYRSSASAYSGPNVGVGVGGGSGNVGVGLGLSVPIISARSGYPGRITVNMNPQ